MTVSKPPAVGGKKSSCEEGIILSVKQTKEERFKYLSVKHSI